MTLVVNRFSLRIFLNCLLGLIFLLPVLAVAKTRVCDVPFRLGKISLMQESPPFIMAYDKNNKDKIIKDRLPDILTQLQASRKLMFDLGFMDPLQSERYKGQAASSILVIIDESLKQNGMAYDEVRKLPDGRCVLIIRLRAIDAQKNLTPSHEYFHLIQYGYAMFKRSWYLEGMARWSQSLIKKEQKKNNYSSFPLNSDDKDSLFKESYTSSAFWGFMARHCSSDSEFSTQTDFSMYRYQSGSSVLTESDFSGVPYIKKFLVNLAALSRQKSVLLDLSPYQWPETLQRSKDFDDAILETAMNSCSVS